MTGQNTERLALDAAPSRRRPPGSPRRRVSRTATVAIVLAAATLLACPVGCAARHIARGDAAMLDNRPAEALQHYRNALRRDEDLAGDAEFQARMRAAKCRAAYAEGQRLAAQGRWEQAIAEYQESLSIDPTFARAASALAVVRQAASKAQYGEAIRWADQGDLTRAGEHLTKALEHWPDNADAAEALASLSGTYSREDGGATTLLAQARELMEQRTWPRAADLLAQAKAANKNLLPARAGLHECKQQMDRAATLLNQGRRLLAQRKLDDAIGSFESALAIWPGLQAARADLSRAEALRQQAEQLHALATAHAARGEWDQTVAATEQALAVYPSHAEALALRLRARREAAEAHCRAGNEYLANDNFAAAEREFRAAAVSYPGWQPARTGLGRVNTIRGDQAASQGLPGSAMLWYLAAREHQPTAQGAALRRARAKVLDRVGFSLAVDLRPGPYSQAATTGDMRAELMRDVFTVKPAFVDVLPARRGDQADYVAVVEVDDVGINTDLVRREHRTAGFTVLSEMPNPAIPQLRARLRGVQRELNELRRKADHKCDACDGEGKTKCPRCKGTGKIVETRPAPKRKAAGPQPRQGEKVAPTTTEARARQPRRRNDDQKAPPSREDKPCPRCKGKGTLPCKPCGGTGRMQHAMKDRIARKQAEAERIRRELRRTPNLIRQHIPAVWEYAVCRYEKTGTVAVRVSIRDQAGRVVARDIPVRASVSFDDTAVENPNARIGVRADDLDLPTDSRVLRAAVQAVAGKAARAALRAAIQSEARACREHIDALSGAGRTAEWIEASVELALLIEPIDAGESAHMLRRLRDTQPR